MKLEAKRKRNRIQNSLQPTVRAKIAHYSKKHGVSEELVYSIVSCETADTFDPLIQSYATYPNGEREKSFGLAQIHLPAHPAITKEMAQNPDFALEFLTSNLAKGRGSMWSCYPKGG